MMALPGTLQLSCGLGPRRKWNRNYNKQALLLKQDCRRLQLSHHVNRPMPSLSCKSQSFKCHSFLVPGQPSELPVVKVVAAAMTRSCNVLQGNPVMAKLIPAVGVITFAIWGVSPLLFLTRKLFLRRDSNWKKSSTNYIVTSYIRPIMLWIGAILMCRALESVALPTETSQIVKERILNFVRSLSTVLSFAYCLSSVIQQAQRFFVQNADANEARNMGFQFAGKAVYSAVWIAAFSLFMELLGFSTQRWLTAGGLGTVLLTLAGREIFTNFLSSLMIHATRPFVVNEWIQTKIEGYEVSGTVEHVGWWSPTIIRGENREAVHVPNHKFTMSVVRNLSQKTHWRIKTHLCISHLDVSKINNIVADMRKVLAKNPQVEQQRLHRRVFLEDINPENQALTILVSCFVKTSRHEEYFRVKEVILLDLLRVIGHHGARLATPVRTLQKRYSDDDLDNIPYADSFVGGASTGRNRPLLLIEPPYKINSDDKTRSHRTQTKHSARTDAKAGSTVVADSNVRETPSNSKSGAKAVMPNSDVNEKSENATSSIVHPTIREDDPPKSDSNTEGNIGLPDISASNSKANLTDSDNTMSCSASNNGRPLDKPSKQQGERKPAEQPPTSRPDVEENIVLGVALEGSKRTLPIEEGMETSKKEAKEMTGWQGGKKPSTAEYGKDK
ncbi:mechanosensitive ion channel protein 2, chloroplastic [Neltuma alba]|uniref:mechanosensitive ion channel protein 2, chloroplastic n=1 Tax=Neltuma alba TaxID=207710 RepID=UPI0010A421E2|nr:mechanosensitive ion channel protein 2, chloroplastic-like [Prosopis alba]